MRIYVTPAAGKMPRAPVPPYTRIPDGGQWVEDNSAWRRLEIAGDITISTSGPADAEPAPQKTKAK